MAGNKGKAPGPASPPALWAQTAWALARSGHLVGRYPGWRTNFHRLPRPAVSCGPSGLLDGNGLRRIFRRNPPLTVAGAAQAGCARGAGHCFLLPVELRHANHTASTNMLILGRFSTSTPTMDRMASGSDIDP